MAIREMTSKDKYEAALAAGLTSIEKVSDYPGHEEGRVHHMSYHSSDTMPKCPHHGDTAFDFAKGPGCNAGCCALGALYMETSYVGKVLALGEYNGYDDSDFYALVWNGDAPIKVVYATTRGWTYPNSAKVDATPEVRAAYEAYKAAAAKRAKEEAAAKLAATPAKGKTLKVVKGRKVPVGTTGTCIWLGKGHYGTRVGIKDSAGDVHWTAVENVAVVL